MKALYGLNVQKKQILFAALMLTLGASKSWTQSAANGTIDLAQNAPAAATVVRPAANASTIRVTVEATAKVGSEEKKAKEEISIEVKTREENDITGINADGTPRRGTSRITELHFSSASCSNCMEPKTITLAPTGMDRTALETYAREALTARLIKEIEAAKVAKRAAENKRQCKIEVTLDNGRTATKKMVGEDRILCLTENLENQNAEGSNAERSRLRNELASEIKKMAFSNDEDDRDRAVELLEDIQGRFNDDEKLEDFFYGMERGLTDRAMEQAIDSFYADLDIIESEGEKSPAGMAARSRMLMAQRATMFASARGSNATEKSGIEEIRKGLLESLDKALKNPKGFVAGNSTSVFDFSRDGGATRHDINIDTFPRLSFDGLTSHRGSNNGSNSGMDPRNNPQFQNRPGYRTGTQVAGNQQPVPMPGGPNMNGPRGRQVINR